MRALTLPRDIAFNNLLVPQCRSRVKTTQNPIVEEKPSRQMRHTPTASALVNISCIMPRECSPIACTVSPTRAWPLDFPGSEDERVGHGGEMGRTLQADMRTGRHSTGSCFVGRGGKQTSFVRCCATEEGGDCNHGAKRGR